MPQNPSEFGARRSGSGGLAERIATVAGDRPIASFLLVTFAWSWSVWLVGLAFGHGDARWLQAVGAWGPLIGATVVTRAAGGDVRAFVGQVIPDRGIGVRWYAIALLAPFVLTQAGVIAGWVLGIPISLADARGTAFAFAFSLLVAGAIEEFGWRGYLQPRLQGRYSALAAAIAVGLIWAAWHVPLALGGAGAGYEAGDAIGLFVGLPLFSIVLAWLYNTTRGGLLFAMLFHATVNATPVFEPAEVTELMQLSELAVLIGLPLTLVLYHGREHLAPTSPDVPGS